MWKMIVIIASLSGDPAIVATDNPTLQRCRENVSMLQIKTKSVLGVGNYRFAWSCRNQTDGTVVGSHTRIPN